MTEKHHRHEVDRGKHLLRPITLPLGFDPDLGNPDPVFAVDEDKYRCHRIAKSVEIDTWVPHLSSRSDILGYELLSVDKVAVLVYNCFVCEQFTSQQSKEVNEDEEQSGEGAHLAQTLARLAQHDPHASKEASYLDDS